MQNSDCILQSIPPWEIEEVEAVPGVKFIQNMNEKGYFWAKFDIQEPIVFKATFENPLELFTNHSGDPAQDFEEELQPGSHTRFLVGNFDLAVLEMKVELLDLEGNLKYETYFSNNPHAGEEDEEEAEAEAEAEYPENELDDDEEME